MYPVIIAIAVLLIFGSWQPTFLQSVSAKDTLNNVLFSNLIPKDFSDNKLNTRAKPIRSEVNDPEIKALAAGVYEARSRFTLWSKNSTTVRPIASITKLMTALVFLDHNPGWEKIVEITADDNRLGSKAYLFLGDTLSVKDLFKTALVASDNTAITALVRSTGLSEEEFVKEMNQKSEALRLGSTVFVEPTGLDSNNQSTVRDITRLALTAFEKPEIRQALQYSRYEFQTKAEKKVIVYSTNDLLGIPSSNSPKLLAGKTGHLPEAGYCFVGWFEHNGQAIVSVVLGAPEADDRFIETQKLVKWAYNGYSW
jgi:D-alanyl-D-alanine carboxypeptidase